MRFVSPVVGVPDLKYSLSLHAAAAAAAAAQQRRFILPFSDCELALSDVLDELQRDAFTTPADERPSRCTGAALQVGAGAYFQRQPCDRPADEFQHHRHQLSISLGGAVKWRF